ncbi:hypothetical protein GCM10019016_059990 [Streptomyces prasinosporus]|uniref:Uncharacterized protein n=1 Tax=Streptomyces prasinosporus TaxID=68256 RepID=A0ABP6TXT2_9ACTN
MSSTGNGRAGRQPVKAGSKQSKAAQPLAQQQEELRRLRALELARDAERRRNGLAAAPVRAEKPSSPSSSRTVKPAGQRAKKASAAAPVKTGKPSSQAALGSGKSSKASRKKKARSASYKEFPGSRPAPVASRGVDRLSGLPKIAPAYMRLTPEEAQRERKKRLAGENKAKERRLAKLARKIEAARKSEAGR